MENNILLVEALKQININIDDEIVKEFKIYKDMLIDWNNKINLTAITDEAEIYIKHFVDSATCISTGYIKEGDKIIDVGTGAGFPGLPIKIIKKDVKITLLDSLNKRINYLNEVVSKLKLKDVELLHSRAEDAGVKKEYREKYDVVLSRAVAPINSLSEYCLPFVKVGGHFICQKGPKYEEDLAGAKKAIEVMGGEVGDIIKYNIPYSDMNHYIIIINKIKNTPQKYPRKAGKPTSDPII